MGIQSKSIEKLIVMKSPVSQEYTADVTVAASMPDTVGTVPVYDENGNILGYMALYANPDLSA